MLEEKKQFGLSGSTLKIIAIVTMLIDHIGFILLERGYLQPKLATNGQIMWENETFRDIFNLDLLLRNIGRLAFPIFCFLLIEGFIHTSNRKKYALRLTVFALVSEIPFNLACAGTIFSLSYQNVFFTLLIGLLVVWCLERFHKHYIIQVLIIAFGCLIAQLLKTDYGFNGILIIVAFYIFYHNRTQRNIAVALTLYFEPVAIFSLLPINCYNQKRGISLKYFFYLFYPLHILILYTIQRFLF